MPSEPSVSRLQAIVLRHAPRGYGRIERPVRGVERPDGLVTVAYVDTEKREIVHEPVVDRETLCMFLHECGHVYFHHRDENKVPPYEEEYEAEVYAWKALRAEGLSVPKKRMEDARDYVRSCLPKDGDNSEVPARVLQFVFGREWRKHR